MSETFEDARRARLDGRYGAAELILRQILDKNPIDALAAGLLGQCLSETGDEKAAREFVELALSLAPQSADVRLNLSALRLQQGDLRAAIEEAHRATQIDAEKFEAWATLGSLYGRAGSFRDAIASLTRACRLNPRNANAALLLAGASVEVRDYAGARRALDMVDAIKADLPAALRLRIHIARGVGDWKGLIEIAARWLKVAPDDEEARIVMAFGLGQLGYHDRASEFYQPVAEAQPPRAEHLAAMGRYRLGARNLAEAKMWFDRALAADPACAEALFGLSRLLTFKGELDEAAAMARRALALNPKHVEAYRQLGEIVEGRFTEEELARLSDLCTDKSLAEDVAAIAHFAYGDGLHKARRHGDAFEVWSQANRLKNAELKKSPAGGYDPAAQERTTSRLIELFPRPAKAASPLETNEPAPIFIVGMPRSGTTLLESAISAHPMVAGAGEVPALPFILDEFLGWAARARSPIDIPAEKRAAWREHYFRQAEKFRNRSAVFFTDKQPSNFLALGLIGQLFPEAKIIHIRRSPMETGFSIFRRNFSRQWPFANGLEDIAHYYGQYARLMEHWEQNFPSAFAFIQYERLVDNFDKELRRLVEFCGLPWDDACLNFHAAERTVITFSAAQVRKPASKDHLGAARPYADYLAPLKEGLEKAGVDLETGALAGPERTLH